MSCVISKIKWQKENGKPVATGITLRNHTTKHLSALAFEGNLNQLRYHDWALSHLGSAQQSWSPRGPLSTTQFWNSWNCDLRFTWHRYVKYHERALRLSRGLVAEARSRSVGTALYSLL